MFESTIPNTRSSLFFFFLFFLFMELISQKWKFVYNICTWMSFVCSLLLLLLLLLLPFFCVFSWSPFFVCYESFVICKQKRCSFHWEIDESFRSTAKEPFAWNFEVCFFFCVDIQAIFTWIWIYKITISWLIKVVSVWKNAKINVLSSAQRWYSNIIGTWFNIGNLR